MLSHRHLCTLFHKILGRKIRFLLLLLVLINYVNDNSNNIIGNYDYNNTSKDDNSIRKKKIINAGNGVNCWSQVGLVIDSLVTKLL